MTPAKRLGCLFLVSSVFILTQSPGWQFGYLVLSAALCFVGLLLVSRPPARRARRYVKRVKRGYVAAQLAGGGGGR